MLKIGIIAEFNPFHKGHEYIISHAKKQGKVVCALSGNFVQRGETAVFEKRIRASMALKCGADVVLELPVLWSMSTAANFALGGVSLLKNAGCDKIMFGSETGDIESLIKLAEILQSTEYENALKSELKEGITFAAARQNAVKRLGGDYEILDGANDNLGIEYIIAAKKCGFQGSFEAIKRKGAGHGEKVEAEFVSSTFLRENLSKGNLEICKKYMPERAACLISGDDVSDMKLIDRAILTTLRCRSISELKKLPDISEGVENKLFSAISTAESFDDLCNNIKVKRYTMARVRRLVLSAFLGEDSQFFMKPVPYLRVLGFTKSGEEIFKGLKISSDIPILSKSSQIKTLSEECQKVFGFECKATDLFGLSLKRPLASGLEYTSKIIKTGE